MREEGFIRELISNKTGNRQLTPVKFRELGESGNIETVNNQGVDT
jgi:hypothetical protein